MATLYNLPALTRGDTLPQRVFTVTEGLDPGDLLSARAQLRHAATGELVHDFEVTVDDEALTITMPAVDPEDTAEWPTGNHPWDLEVVTSGGTFTWLKGTIAIAADTTLPEE